MRIAMVGLGRMGANMALRLMKAGHEVVVWDHSAAAIQSLASQGAIAAKDPQDLVSKLSAPKAIWMMIPAAFVDDSIATFAPLLSTGDILIDGGNSYYKDDIRRAKESRYTTRTDGCYLCPWNASRPVDRKILGAIKRR